MPREYIRIPPRDRFWALVDKQGPTPPDFLDPCWLFLTRGSRMQFNLASGRDGTTRVVVAACFAWEERFGVYPSPKQLTRDCPTDRCINPEHHFLPVESPDRYREFLIPDFLALVDVRDPDECWPWQGGSSDDGYGLFHAFRPAGSALASRFALELWLERAIAPGLCALHSCDNPICVNPAHLREGTMADNSHDMVERGRARNNPITGEVWAQAHDPAHIRRGEAVNTAKLTATLVREIRRRGAQGESQHELATAFGISQIHAGRVLNRQCWKHITE